MVRTRLSISVLLSWMVHSTTSPFSNSSACATAAGKLMYHCSLFCRWMTWTLVGYPIEHIGSRQHPATTPAKAAPLDLDPSDVVIYDGPMQSAKLQTHLRRGL